MRSSLIRPRFPGFTALCLALLLLAGCSSKAPLQSCSLKRVGDGDSVNLSCTGQAVKVRLYCIDAPEMGQRPWGDQAKAYLKAMLPEQLLIRPIEKDRYGRTVAELFSTGEDRQNYNLAMIMAGQARVYRRYCKLDEYIEREQQARSYQVGIWSKPGLHQQPWKWRRKHPRR